MPPPFSPLPESLPTEPGMQPVLAERHETASDFGMIAEPMLRQLADYWLSCRQGSLMPRRADIDPLDIPWALPHLFLVDCVAAAGADGGNWRYRYRLAGEEIEAVFRDRLNRSSMRNTWLEESMPAHTLAATMHRWRPLPEQGHILYMHGMIYRLSNRFARGGRLMLPLAEEANGPVSGLIGITVCDWIGAAPPPASGEADVTITHIPASTLA